MPLPPLEAQFRLDTKAFEEQIKAIRGQVAGLQADLSKISQGAASATTKTSRASTSSGGGRGGRRSSGGGGASGGGDGGEEARRASSSYERLTKVLETTVRTFTDALNTTRSNTVEMKSFQKASEDLAVALTGLVGKTKTESDELETLKRNAIEAANAVKRVDQSSSANKFRRETSTRQNVRSVLDFIGGTQAERNAAARTIREIRNVSEALDEESVRLRYNANLQDELAKERDKAERAASRQTDAIQRAADSQKRINDRERDSIHDLIALREREAKLQKQHPSYARSTITQLARDEQRFLKDFSSGIIDKATFDKAIRQSGEIAKNIEATRKASQGIAGFFNNIAANLGRIAVFSVAAGIIVRGTQAIATALADTVREGIKFNAEMEQSKFSIGAILASGRELRTEMGNAVSVAESLPVFIGKAEKFQRELLVRNIETLGTYEELRDVFQRVLAFSNQQKATDEERLQLAQNILNAGKLLGLTGDQLTTETRQILTLEQNRGQLILQSLGLTVQQLRTYKEQGTLVQVLNERLQAYSTIADDLALTFEGLTTTVQTFFSIISGQAFEDTFGGLKDILKGAGDELKRLSEAGDLFVGLDANKEDLEALGVALAKIVAEGTKGLAKIINAFLELGATAAPALEKTAEGMEFLFDSVTAGIENLKIAKNLIGEIAAKAQSLSSGGRQSGFGDFIGGFVPDVTEGKGSIFSELFSPEVIGTSAAASIVTAIANAVSTGVAEGWRGGLKGLTRGGLAGAGAGIFLGLTFKAVKDLQTALNLEEVRQKSNDVNDSFKSIVANIDRIRAKKLTTADDIREAITQTQGLQNILKDLEGVIRDTFEGDEEQEKILVLEKLKTVVNGVLDPLIKAKEATDGFADSLRALGQEIQSEIIGPAIEKEIGALQKLDTARQGVEDVKAGKKTFEQLEEEQRVLEDQAEAYEEITEKVKKFLANDEKFQKMTQAQQELALKTELASDNTKVLVVQLSETKTASRKAADETKRLIESVDPDNINKFAKALAKLNGELAKTQEETRKMVDSLAGFTPESATRGLDADIAEAQRARNEAVAAIQREIDAGQRTPAQGQQLIDVEDEKLIEAKSQAVLRYKENLQKASKEQSNFAKEAITAFSDAEKAQLGAIAAQEEGLLAAKKTAFENAKSRGAGYEEQARFLREIGVLEGNLASLKAKGARSDASTLQKELADLERQKRDKIKEIQDFEVKSRSATGALDDTRKADILKQDQQEVVNLENRIAAIKAKIAKSLAEGQAADAEMSRFAAEAETKVNELTNEYNRALADLQEKTAQLVRKNAETFADITHTPGTFLQNRIDEIKEERKEAEAQLRNQGKPLTAAFQAEFDRQDLEKLKAAQLDQIKNLKSFADEKVRIQQELARAEHELAQASLETQQVLNDQRQDNLETELEILRARDADYPRQIQLIKEIGQAELANIEIQRQAAEAAATLAEAEANLAAIRLEARRLESRKVLDDFVGTPEEKKTLETSHNAELDVEARQVEILRKKYEALRASVGTFGDKASNSIKKTNEELRQLTTTTVHLGDAFAKAIGDLVTGSQKGLRGLKNVFKQLGKDINDEFANAFREMLRKKLKLDITFENNFLDLGKTLGGAFGAGAQTAGGFLENLGKFATNIFGKITGLFSGTGGGAGGSGLSGLASLLGGGGGGFVPAQPNNPLDTNISQIAGRFISGGPGTISGGFGGLPGLPQQPTGPISGPFDVLSVPGGGIGDFFKSDFGALLTSFGIKTLGATLFDSKSANKGANIGGTVGSISGAIGGSILGGPAGAKIGSIIGNAIGSFIGGLIGDLFGPGRIAKEKSKIEDFFEETFGDKSYKIVKEKQAARGFEAFPELGPAAKALGVDFANTSKDGNAGTIVRFAGQGLGNFERLGLDADAAKENILELARAMDFDLRSGVQAIKTAIAKDIFSIKEFKEEIKEARKNLKEYGDTSDLTAKELTELATANGNTGSNIVTLNDALAGTIAIATEFNSLIDSTVLANIALANAFADAAFSGQTVTDEMQDLQIAIGDGLLSVEEAIIQFNKLNDALGIEDIGLDDLEIDTKAIERTIKAVEDIAEDLRGAIQNGLKTGVKTDGTVEEIARQVRHDLYNSIFDAVIEAFTDGFIQAQLAVGPLSTELAEIIRLGENFAEGTITQEQFLSAIHDQFVAIVPVVERIGLAVGLTSQELKEVLRSAGILPDLLDEAAANTGTLKDAVKEAIDAGIKGAKAIDIGNQFRNDIYTSIYESVLDGFVDGFIQASLAAGPIQDALTAISDLNRDFLKGTIDQAQYLTGVQTAFEAIGPTVERLAVALGIGSDALRQMLQDAGVLDNILGEAEESDFISTLKSAASGAIVEGVTEQKTQAEIQKAFRKLFYRNIFEQVVDGFVDGMIKALTVTGPLKSLFQNISDAIEAFSLGGSQDDFFTTIQDSFTEMAPVIQAMAEAVGIAAGHFTEILKEAGIFEDVLGDASDEAAELAKELRQAAQDLLLDDALSPLKKRDRLPVAEQEFEQLRQRALAGDKEAARQLPEAGRKLLEIARDIFASSLPYEKIFDFVRGSLLDVANVFGPIEDQATEQLRTVKEIRDAAQKTNQILETRLNRDYFNGILDGTVPGPGTGGGAGQNPTTGGGSKFILPKPIIDEYFGQPRFTPALPPGFAGNVDIRNTTGNTGPVLPRATELTNGTFHTPASPPSDAVQSTAGVVSNILVSLQQQSTDHLAKLVEISRTSLNLMTEAFASLVDDIETTSLSLVEIQQDSRNRGSNVASPDRITTESLLAGISGGIVTPSSAGPQGNISTVVQSSSPESGSLISATNAILTDMYNAHLRLLDGIRQDARYHGFVNDVRLTEIRGRLDTIISNIASGDGGFHAPATPPPAAPSGVSLAEGGIVRAKEIAATLHGPEAVIPLSSSGLIDVNVPGLNEALINLRDMINIGFTTLNATIASVKNTNLDNLRIGTNGEIQVSSPEILAALEEIKTATTVKVEELAGANVAIPEIRTTTGKVENAQEEMSLRDKFLAKWKARLAEIAAMPWEEDTYSYQAPPGWKNPFDFGPNLPPGRDQFYDPNAVRPESYYKTIAHAVTAQDPDTWSKTFKDSLQHLADMEKSGVSLAEGGIVRAKEVSATLHGPEAVIPLNASGLIDVRVPGLLEALKGVRDAVNTGFTTLNSIIEGIKNTHLDSLYIGTGGEIRISSPEILTALQEMKATTTTNVQKLTETPTVSAQEGVQAATESVKSSQEEMSLREKFLAKWKARLAEIAAMPWEEDTYSYVNPPGYVNPFDFGPNLPPGRDQFYNPDTPRPDSYFKTLAALLNVPESQIRSALGSMNSKSPLPILGDNVLADLGIHSPAAPKLSMAEGGIVKAKEVVATLHGPEAVIPLRSDGLNINISPKQEEANQDIINSTRASANLLADIRNILKVSGAAGGSSAPVTIINASMTGGGGGGGGNNPDPFIRNALQLARASQIQRITEAIPQALAETTSSIVTAVNTGTSVQRPSGTLSNLTSQYQYVAPFYNPPSYPVSSGGYSSAIGFAEGGIIKAPELTMPTTFHGPEAIIPLPSDGLIPARVPALDKLLSLPVRYNSTSGNGGSISTGEIVDAIHDLGDGLKQLGDRIEDIEFPPVRGDVSLDKQKIGEFVRREVNEQLRQGGIRVPDNRVFNNQFK